MIVPSVVCKANATTVSRVRVMSVGLCIQCRPTFTGIDSHACRLTCINRWHQRESSATSSCCRCMSMVMRYVLLHHAEMQSVRSHTCTMQLCSKMQPLVQLSSGHTSLCHPPCPKLEGCLLLIQMPRTHSQGQMQDCACMGQLAGSEKPMVTSIYALT